MGQIGVRLSAQERAKLEALARQTERTISEVVRVLIRQALVAERPDIYLDNPKEVQPCQK